MSWRPKKRKTADGRTVWIARFKDDQGRERIAKPDWNDRNGTFKLKREAQRAIDEAIMQRIPDRASTVGSYLDRWLRTHPRSERTDRTNASHIRNVLDLELDGLELRLWDMRDLRRRHGQELVGLMLAAQGRAPEGARGILRSLSCMFEDAITDELCDINPWQGVKVREDDRRAVKQSRVTRVWTFQQMHDFADHASYRPKPATGKPAAAPRPAPEYRPMLRLLADCGLRIGELFALERADIDGDLLNISGSAWEGRVLASNEVKNHNRSVPVPPGTLEVLRSTPVRIDTLWLCPTPTGKLWRYSNWHRQVWEPTCLVAGIDPTPHEFRHSWVTHLRAAGIDPADLADVAGHSVMTATSRYTHPLRRSHDEIRRMVG